MEKNKLMIFLAVSLVLNLVLLVSLVILQSGYKETRVNYGEFCKITNEHIEMINNDSELLKHCYHNFRRENMTEYNCAELISKSFQEAS